MALNSPWNRSSKELLNEADAASKAFAVCRAIVDHWDNTIDTLSLDEVVHLARIALAKREEARRL
jgi:hypothetical protein